MQNPNPPVYVPPPAYPYPYPSPARGAESARGIALGVLNIIFGYVYLVIAVLLLLGSTGNSYLPPTFWGWMMVLAIAWAGLGLFIGGIFLTLRKGSALKLIVSAFWVLLIGVLILLITIISQIGWNYFGRILAVYGTLAVLFLFYPFIAMKVVKNSEDQLGV